MVYNLFEMYPLKVYKQVTERSQEHLYACAFYKWPYVSACKYIFSLAPIFLKHEVVYLIFKSILNKDTHNNFFTVV